MSSKSLTLLQGKVDTGLYRDFRTEVKEYEGRTIKWYLEHFLTMEICRIRNEKEKSTVSTGDDTLLRAVKDGTI